MCRMVSCAPLTSLCGLRLQLLGIGMACAGIRTDVEPAMSMIGEYLNGEKPATHNMKVRRAVPT